MTLNKLEKLKAEVRSELIQNILPFWTERMIDNVNGGFFGRIDGSGEVHPEADKGSVLNTRILWTFSSAGRVLQNDDYLLIADRSKDYLMNNFFDSRNNGIFWLLDNRGKVKDGKKQIYAEAFAIYALVEYYRTTNDEVSLEKAIELFRLIEKHSFDTRFDGYFEAFSMDWGELTDLRLSEKDANEKKTMNTHLHVLEAYTNLYRVWKDEHLKQQLERLIRVFTDKIVNNRTFNLNMFFDEEWNDKTDLISYGHNIESSWLLYEAAVVLGEQSIIQKVKDISLSIADTSKDGIMPDGSMIYEKFFKTGHIDYDRHWWVQAESVAGFLNAFHLSGKEEYLDLSLAAWKFISDNLIDKKNGEWYWGVDNDLKPNTKDDKAGFWKCPYHNSRMCLEIIEKVP
jgi:mannobiose 2-epimerase